LKIKERIGGNQQKDEKPKILGSAVTTTREHKERFNQKTKKIPEKPGLVRKKANWTLKVTNGQYIRHPFGGMYFESLMTEMEKNLGAAKWTFVSAGGGRKPRPATRVGGGRKLL